MKKSTAAHPYTRGFTLVELMVVIAVIAILVTIVAVTYTGARSRAADTRRLTDMKAITKALDMYKIKNGSYPAVAYGAGTSFSGWESSALEPVGEFLKPVGVEYYGFPRGVAVDPENDGTQNYVYLYYVYSAGNSGCDVARGAFYVLGIKRTSTTNTSPHPSSPGFACAARDWQTEFAWVTGGFTR